MISVAKKFIKRAAYSRSKRIFCISIQRTGTTSVGKFFQDFGYRWSGWPAAEANNWIKLWEDGDFEKIFSSYDFMIANAFEDSPWWFPGFYKILFHRFHGAKFILFKRNPERWFQSMITHSNGDILGDSLSHCKVYRREHEYYELIKTLEFSEEVENRTFGPKTMKLRGHDEQYISLYNLHQMEVQQFFARHDPSALFFCDLEDPMKWVKLGNFLGIQVAGNYEVHENSSKAR